MAAVRPWTLRTPSGRLQSTNHLGIHNSQTLTCWHQRWRSQKSVPRLKELKMKKLHRARGVHKVSYRPWVGRLLFKGLLTEGCITPHIYSRKTRHQEMAVFSKRVEEKINQHSKIRLDTNLTLSSKCGRSRSLLPRMLLNVSVGSTLLKTQRLGRSKEEQ